MSGGCRALRAAGETTGTSEAKENNNNVYLALHVVSLYPSLTKTSSETLVWQITFISSGQGNDQVPFSYHNNLQHSWK